MSDVPTPEETRRWVIRFVVLVVGGGFASLYSNELGWPTVIAVVIVGQLLAEIVLRLRGSNDGTHNS